MQLCLNPSCLLDRFLIRVVPSFIAASCTEDSDPDFKSSLIVELQRTVAAQGKELKAAMEEVRLLDVSAI